MINDNIYITPSLFVMSVFWISLHKDILIDKILLKFLLRLVFC